MNYNNPVNFPKYPRFPSSTNTSHALINDKRILIQRTVKRKIRPEPFPSTTTSFTQTIIKTRLLENLFMGTAISKRSKVRGPNAKDYKCIVFKYQFTNLPKSKLMIFLPCMLDEFLSEEYVCKDCFQVFSLFSMKQRDLDPLPTFDPIALKPEVDPRTLPHYCVHFRSFYPEIVYFNEYEAYLDNTAGGSLVDLAFLFGMFMTKMKDYHVKVTNFLNAKKPKTLDQLINYVISINLAIKNEQQALSFLHCFHHFHSNNKQSPLLDDKESLSLLLKKETEDEPTSMQSNNKTITFEQLISEDFSDEDSNLMNSIDHLSKPKFRGVPYKSRHSSKCSNKKKPVPSVNEMTSLINRVIIATNVKATPDELAMSIKDIRLLVLYYAPTRLNEFDKITKEVLSQVTGSTNN